MTALTLEAAAQAYGHSAYEKARLLQGTDLSSAQRAAVRRAINKDIRHFGDLVTPELLRPLTSRAAVEAARELGVDLCRQTWASQPSFDTGRASGRFHLEHMLPVDMQVAEIITATTADGAEQVLLGSRVAWILKAENARLTAGGHSKRRPNPDAAYEGASIELVDCCPRS